MPNCAWIMVVIFSGQDASYHHAALGREHAWRIKERDVQDAVPVPRRANIGDARKFITGNMADASRLYFND